MYAINECNLFNIKIEFKEKQITLHVNTGSDLPTLFIIFEAFTNILVNFKYLIIRIVERVPSGIILRHRLSLTISNIDYNSFINLLTQGFSSEIHPSGTEISHPSNIIAFEFFSSEDVTNLIFNDIQLELIKQRVIGFKHELQLKNNDKKTN